VRWPRWPAPTALAAALAELRVNSGGAAYEVRVGPGLVQAVGRWVRERAGGARVLVVCDHNTVMVAGQRIADDSGAAILELEPGERTKSFEELRALCLAMADAGLERRSIVVAVGGGVVGDLTGTAAAIYLRGIRLVQVPTTLLAMVDSSIGGKVGVNLPAGKNLVGAFKAPEAVFADTGLLAGLPEREFRSGLAEVIKSGLIADAGLTAMLTDRREEVLARDAAVLEAVVARTCAVKVGVVNRDATEVGERAILNYGHTFGHALEAASGYAAGLTHGMAVAAGMAVAGRVGASVGVTPPEVVEVQQRQLEDYGLPQRAPVAVAAMDLLGALGRDKKAAAGRVRWVLLEAVGHATWGHEVPDEVVGEAVAWGLGGNPVI
jgi:3-dehydroquinate synthase